MFKANLEKLRWCIVWVLNQKKCTPEHLTEIIFQAEIDHLNQHARPITGVPYYKGSGIICLEIIKIYTELGPMIKSLPIPNTKFLSISDINCLTKYLTKSFTLNPYLQSLAFNDLIDYREMIFNEEIIEYLKENDLFSVVI